MTASPTALTLPQTGAAAGASHHLGTIAFCCHKFAHRPASVILELRPTCRTYCPLCPLIQSVPQVAVILMELKITDAGTAGVAQWIERQPVNQRVSGSIPSQGTCVGCRPGPQVGARERQPHIDVSLPLSLSPSLLLCLKINKLN